MVAVFRNLAAMKNIRMKSVEWSLIALGVVLGVLFNNRGWLGWLPIVANLEYSIAMFQFRENEGQLKTAFLLNALMYSVFNAVIQNYVGAASNIIVAVTTACSLINQKKRNRKKRKTGTRKPEVIRREMSRLPSFKLAF